MNWNETAMSFLSCHLLKETKEEVLTDLFVAWGRQASSWRDLFLNLQFSLSPLPAFSGGESESLVRADDSEVPFKDMWNKFCETRQDSQLVYATVRTRFMVCKVLWRQIQGDHRRMESSWGGALEAPHTQRWEMANANAASACLCVQVHWTSFGAMT